MQLTALGALLLATGSFVTAASTKSASSKTSSGVLAVESPTWLPDFPTPKGVNSGYPTGKLDTSKTLPRETLDTKSYPEPWAAPDVNHPEVKKVIAAIDWSKVPKAAVRKNNKNGDIIFKGYPNSDPDCWWSQSGCTKPKLSYLPEDVHYCPTPGDWGLNYDDGPFNLGGEDKELDKWAEPELYNFLAENNNQKATLFYIGSNVVTYPEAAKRAINHGHVLCSHTWSHPQMTTQTNEQVVAQLYWSLRAIKEATGVTTKCWRPPQGDVDDRVRAIAWQMGLHTYLWNGDTNDWNMPGSGGGDLAPAKVDALFEKWIADAKAHKDKTGLIVLEHELNNATVKMTEKWLPKLQSVFNVKSIHQCLNISQPYWEKNWVYPVGDETVPAAASNTTEAAASNTTEAASNNATDAASTNATATTTTAAAGTTDITLSSDTASLASSAAPVPVVATAPPAAESTAASDASANTNADATNDASANTNALANSQIETSGALSNKATQSAAVLTAAAAIAAYVL
ncbi:Chitin deacetylase [Choanephora cucurbitarum]|uniref:Chitin deacetylase n=1 Tax=Choanephora cucurbitarum TaxID=101091 RepID=A0A1C7NPQ7_9FUNG|nr:Chitin deacetylase [Choanephora cucurbitarum]